MTQVIEFVNKTEPRFVLFKRKIPGREFFGKSGTQDVRIRVRSRHDHLYQNRRSTGARHPLPAANHPGLLFGQRRCGRTARHFACGPHPRRLPRAPETRTTPGRRPRRTRPQNPGPPRQHHQIAQYLRIGAADEGGDQRVAGKRLRLARLSRRTRKRAGSRDQGALRPGEGQRGQSGFAGRQFRPPRPGLGQGLCPQASPRHGRLVGGFGFPCFLHGRGRFLRQ